MQLTAWTEGCRRGVEGRCIKRFKGVEGKSEVDKGGGRSRCVGRERPQRSLFWEISSFPKRLLILSIILSKIVPTRKETDSWWRI